jgi:hypothetical protein
MYLVFAGAGKALLRRREEAVNRPGTSRRTKNVAAKVGESMVLASFRYYIP